ncbi:hypothetical protein ACPCIZ_12945 [Streptomyces cellulosae]
MTTPDNVALELEKLRRVMEVGFTDLNGKIDRLTERGERTVADVAALEVRMTAVERRVWGASGAAALAGMAVPTLLQFFGG